MYTFQSLNISLGVDQDNRPIGAHFIETINLNNDGLPDLVVTQNAQANDQFEFLPILLLQSVGDSFVDVTSELLSEDFGLQLPRDIHVADFNGDGREDIFFSNHGTERFASFDSLPGEQNRLLLSMPDGRFSDATATSLPQIMDFSHHSDVADFDGDGDIDIFVNNLGSDGGFESYLILNNGSGVFSIADNLPTEPTRFDSLEVPGGGHGNYGVIAFDTDNDGDVDIFHSGTNFVEGQAGPNFRYFENDGSGAFFLTENAVPDVRAPLHIEAGDVNGDGFKDVLIFEDTGNSTIRKFGFQLLINDGTGGFEDQTFRLRGVGDLENDLFLGHAVNLQLVDLDGDGDLDIYSIGFQNFGNPPPSGNIEDRSYSYLNDGDGFFDRIPIADLPDVNPASFAIDADGDGFSEIFSDMLYSDLWLEDETRQFLLFSATEETKAASRPAAATAERLFGDSDADEIYGLGGADTLIGRGGADLIEGGGGKDSIKGGGGSDILFGGGGKDIIKGGGGGDEIKGDVGRDKLFGNGGGDMLGGGGGRDEVFGGGGSDTIEGSRGSDFLTGGSGRDLFRFSSRDGKETITDFRHGQDRMEIDGATFDDLDIRQVGDNAVIRFERLTVIAEDQDRADFGASDFLF